MKLAHLLDGANALSWGRRRRPHHLDRSYGGTIPLARRPRRSTTLPAPPQPTSAKESKALANFSMVFKTEYSGAIRNYMHQAKQVLWKNGADAGDPWDEAVKSIERRHAADAEWPWPKRGVIG